MLVVNIQSLMPKIIMVFLIGKQLCLWTLAKPLVNIHMSIYKKFPLRPRWPFMLQYFYISIFFLDLSSKKITNLPNLIVCYFRRPYCTYIVCQIASDISLREQVQCCPPYPADVRNEDKQDAYCPAQWVQSFWCHISFMWKFTFSLF